METIQKLIALHKYNLNNLRAKRGMTQWVSGDITSEDIVQVLKEYPNKVGILLYTYKENTLIVNLIDKEKNILTEEINIPKEELLDKVNKVNQYFATDFLAHSPIKRGVIRRVETNKTLLLENYEYISKILLRFDLENFDHLMIVPTLNIGTIPFSALKVSETEYLIDKVSYSIAPSIYELMVSDNINNQLVEDYEFGNGVYDYYASLKNGLLVVNPTYPTNTNWIFPNLPGTLKEVAYIKESMNFNQLKELKGAKATFENIRENICAYNLIYFGTHGLSDEENPLDKSFLVIAENSAGKRSITAREIQDIRHDCQLKANLVILSACETGLGKEHEGGVIGLTRAFQIAGANHIMMSLWSINDQETAILIQLFLKYLKQGGAMLPHEAMRQAILEYKVDKDNPNYWASFSIFGVPVKFISPNNA